jgi:hypothetical protein
MKMMLAVGSNDMPEAERVKLLALQARHRRLLTMLPTDVDDLAELDTAHLEARLADIEMIATEMLTITDVQRTILFELNRRSRSPGRGRLFPVS